MSAIVAIQDILSILVAVICGGLLAVSALWLPMLLFSMLFFLASLIVQTALGTSVAAGLGWSCLSVAVLQVAYVVVGRLPYRIGRYRLATRTTALPSATDRRK